jgi:hypothetical protein
MPEGWVVDTMPVDAMSRGPYGSYSVHAREKDGRILMISEQSIANIEISPRRFPDLVDFWTKARRNATQEIVLKKL